MSDTAKLKHCPKCGSPIPAEAPQGLCPKCLLAQASIPTEAVKDAKAAPPSLKELAAAFPQLEILGLIGQGGMGFVFKARQPKLDRLVALKILPQSLAADSAFAERFTREGRLLARLNHPNIVTIHDFGQADGFFYLLMEFVDGVNLRQAMRAGRFRPDQALAVVPRICDALQFAHNEGVLHRDIKPENILLDTRGRLKIADFGLAKLIGEPHADAALTASGGTLGTPHYMAPEQIEKPATVDHRADIYSLGVVFYEMLTGELPIGKFQPPSKKVEVDVRLDDVVLHALEKEPARRYQQVSEVKTAVDTITSGAPAAKPAEARPKKWALSRREFGIAAAVLGVVAILVAMTGFIAARQRNLAVRAERLRAVSAGVQRDAVNDVGSTAKLVLETEKYKPVHPEPGQLDWGFKVFVPPDHLASFVFVHWTNGVPTVEPAFSTYFKVGKAGGIDIPFCLVACHRFMESEEFTKLTESQRAQSLAGWWYPESAGVTNAVRWNVNLGANETVSALKAMPPYHRVEMTLPQSVESGKQLRFPLIEFEPRQGSAGNGWSGVELRVFLEPLRLPPIRMLPNEKGMTNYVAARGLAWPVDEALRRITNRADAAGVEPADLRRARAELAALRVSYGDNHPRVLAVRARISELERLSREQPDSSPELRELKAKLAEARVNYGDGHPVIQALRAQIRELERK